MRERWTAPDRLLLGVTLALLASRPAVTAFDLVRFANIATFRLNYMLEPLFAAGCFAAWAGVAWRCRGVGPRGVALAAGLLCAALTGADVADRTVLPWQRDMDWRSWVGVAVRVVYNLLWVPALPLLMFCRDQMPGAATDGRPTGRGAADRWLLAVTLTLLAWWPAVAATAAATGRPGGVLAKVFFDGRSVAAAAGSFLAWGAVAWVCRGPAARRVALAAALGYAVAGGAFVAESNGLPWLATVNRAKQTTWVFVVFNLVQSAAWAPAIPLLVFSRRWGDPPRA